MKLQSGSVNYVLGRSAKFGAPILHFTIALITYYSLVITLLLYSKKKDCDLDMQKMSFQTKVKVLIGCGWFLPIKS